LGGFYKVRFQLGDAVGRSVMYARDAKLLGGNSAFAHVGTYEAIGDEVAIEVKTIRHNPDPNYRAMAGTDDATLLARGWPDGDVYRFKGELKELPGVAFQSVMTPIKEDEIPIAGRVGEGGIVNGLYSIHIRMLDGVDGRMTGVMLLNQGRILGGDASFYYLGSYTGKRPLEAARSSPGAYAGHRREPIFGGHEVGIGFSRHLRRAGARWTRRRLSAGAARLTAVLKLIRRCKSRDGQFRTRSTLALKGAVTISCWHYEAANGVRTRDFAPTLASLERLRRGEAADP
jgi:hypothetical protein